ncbi:MAG: S8 family serine peptidase, partial [Kiritimatiellaeota bacterium]|nr:S8 family serine peptidase [Kiritimatiellota bacterium]
MILLGGVCGAFAESAAPVGYEPRPRVRPAERVMALAVGVAESDEEDVYPQPRERVWKAPRPQPINDIAVRELPFGVNAVPVWYDWDLAGEGQIVGHCDSGLDTGNVATMHPDFRGRVTGVILGTNVASWTDYRGHGTYTAGSLAGNGAMSGGAIRGVAWKAHIYHQGMGYGYEDFPDDLAEMYQPAYDFGARVHSGSWAALAGGTYCELDEQVDLFVWRNQEFLPVLGAGNSASDGGAYSREILEFLEEIADFLEEVGFTYAPADFTADGRVDPRSVGTPASAKNVICAGACESERPTGHGSGDVYNATLFPLPPIRGDLQNSGNIDGAGIYRKGVAAFSGRGPTFDGRIKPDLLAPGAMTLSTASRMGGNYPGNPYYTYCWGTSMSTPYIAGCAALAREHLIKRAGITAPTAALVRATLINGAVSLAPGQFGTG